MLEQVKRWSVTVVGILAVVVVAGYAVLSAEGATTTAINTSVAILLALLITGAGVGISRKHDADFAASVALWTVVSATVGVAINQWYLFLLRGVLPDNPFYFTISSVAVTAAFGTATGYYYTALLRKKEEVETANDRLRDRNRRLDEFASVISHDLRNPLNVAQGQLSIARERDGSDDRFDKVADAHSRMERLIDEVLSFARQGEEVYEPEDVRLAEVAENAAGASEASDVRVDVEAGGTLRADRNRLRTVFDNLFRNVVEHADDASVEVGTDDDLIFYVEDDGPGIPPDEREHVFEGGYSTKDGGGFGLATVRRTAEVHGWRVRVTEGDSGGARFEFVEEGD